MIKSEANGPLNGPGLARIGNESTHVSHVSHVSLSPPDSTDCFPWFRAICYLLSAISPETERGCQKENNCYAGKSHPGDRNQQTNRRDPGWEELPDYTQTPGNSPKKI